MVMEVEGRVREEWGRGIEFLGVLLQLGRLFFIVKEMFHSKVTLTTPLAIPHLFNNVLNVRFVN